MRRIRHHVNPLKASYAVAAAPPVALPARGVVEVELGCADARFLFARAAAHPAITCVGVEIRAGFIDAIEAEARARGLANLRAVAANVNTDLDGLFPDGRLARVFLLFPDPWFKRRHHKRRVLTPEVAELLHRKIAPGGELFFQSDVFDLALDAMAVLEESALFDNASGPWSFAPANPYGAQSLREVRCEEKGMRIWRLRYLRR
jgi:tRNA (guanine-N7-)-methyltransferase